MTKKLTMDECIEYLCTSDEHYAEAKAKVKYLDKKLKVVKAKAFLSAEGSVAVRDAISRSSIGYTEALEEYGDAVLDMETMGVKRETIFIRIEIWRTKSANTRKGNI